MALGRVGPLDYCHVKELLHALATAGLHFCRGPCSATRHTTSQGFQDLKKKEEGEKNPSQRLWQRESLETHRPKEEEDRWFY